MSIVPYAHCTAPATPAPRKDIRQRQAHMHASKRKAVTKTDIESNIRRRKVNPSVLIAKLREATPSRGSPPHSPGERMESMEQDVESSKDTTGEAASRKRAAGGGERQESGKRAKCEHGRQKSKCKDCGGSGICPHKKLKSSCAQCKAERRDTRSAASAAGQAGQFGDSTHRAIHGSLSEC
jgi:hypothetical protein